MFSPDRLLLIIGALNDPYHSCLSSLTLLPTGLSLNWYLTSYCMINPPRTFVFIYLVLIMYLVLTVLCLLFTELIVLIFLMQQGCSYSYQNIILTILQIVLAKDKIYITRLSSLTLKMFPPALSLFPPTQGWEWKCGLVWSSIVRYPLCGDKAKGTVNP